jgi:4-amino-4-deoxy-L-arabinose transferase-like glycosyltransferase
MSFRLQEIIHKVEHGPAYRYLSYFVGIIFFATVAVCYDGALYRNLSTIEGMDAAQLARNLAEGNGYTTDFIRPFSIHLLRKHQGGTNALPAAHPDLSNAPIYPALLAGTLRLMPFGHEITSGIDKFRVHAPDLWITGVNQTLFLLAVALVFLIARRLFDPAVAWLASSIVLGTELLWRFSNSGLSTLLLIVFFLAIFWSLAGIDLLARDQTDTHDTQILFLAALIGLSLGLGMLTRYSFGWVIIPAIAFLSSTAARNRAVAVVTAILITAAIVTPWLLRNYNLSGTLFGTAGYALFQQSFSFQAFDLERSLQPDFSLIRPDEFAGKLLRNGRELLADIPNLGGSWMTALFIAGLLLPFRSAVLGRMRWFVVSSLATLLFAQALGQTQLSKDSPVVNSENLLIIVFPAIVIYGASLLFNLLEQFAAPATRFIITGIFFLLATAPLILAFFAPHPSPIVYPPYAPPWIQAKANYIERNQWLVSDIPWAMAWYGNRPTVWLPLKPGSATNAHENFYALHALRPVRGLYLTAKTLKSVDTQTLLQWRHAEADDKDWRAFEGIIGELGDQLSRANAPEQMLDRLKQGYQLTQKHWVRGGGDTWESFVLGVIINQEVPAGFPLQRAPEPLWHEIFLTDSERSGKKYIKGSETNQKP